MSNPSGADETQLPSNSALAPLESLFPTAGDDAHYLADHGGDDSSHIIIDPSLMDEVAHVQPGQQQPQRIGDVGEGVEEDAEEEGGEDDVDDDVNLEATGADPNAASTSAAAASATSLEQRVKSRKLDLQAGMEVTQIALQQENARLREIVKSLERGENKGHDVSHDAATLDTLREFAHSVNRLDFDDILDDSGVDEVDWDNVGGQQQGTRDDAEAPVSRTEGNQEEQDNIEATARDFIHGLVTSVTLADPSGVEITPCDPFAITRLALTNELAAVRAAIAAREADLAALAKGMRGKPQPVTEADSAVEAQAAQAAEAVESVKQKAGVLRDMAARLQTGVDELKEEVDALQSELAGLVHADSEGDKVEHEMEVKNVMLQVRSNVEGLLRQLKERGTLPHAPLSLFTHTSLDASSPQTTPLLRKRGRPPRSAVSRTALVPSHLTHLVPELDVVRQREQDTPIRRKGVKRTRDELEKERKREEEEGDMFRSLVGMGVGVWAGNGKEVGAGIEQERGDEV